jgi:general stress protein 26
MSTAVGKVERPQHRARASHMTFEMVLRQLRKHNFAVLSTVGEDARPASAGVTYGVSRPGRDLALYMMTRTHLQKARNIARNPQVCLVIPLPRRLLSFLPPPTIQVRGRAEILDWTDIDGIKVFQHFWMGRRILAAYQEAHRRGETRICFLKITLDPVVSMYMVGSSVWALRSRMESGAAKITIPTVQRASSPASPSPWP